VQAHLNRQRCRGRHGLDPEQFGVGHKEGDAGYRNGTGQCAAPPLIDDIDKWTGTGPGLAGSLIRAPLGLHPLTSAFNRFLGNEASE
jgi:hypothetical protein